MKRDWLTLLTEAKANGLCCKEVAEQQGCTRSVVSRAQRTHGIRLVKKYPGRTRGKGIHHPPKTRTLTEAFVAAATSLESANAFCLRMNISHSKLLDVEKAHGIKLPRRTPRQIGART